MKFLTIATVLPALLIASNLAFAGQDMRLDELPAAVQATVKREVKAGQIHEIERDVKRGQTVYEVEFYERERKFEIEVGSDGTLLDRKED